MLNQISDYIERNGWLMFVLALLLTTAQVVALAGVAYAHAHYTVVPVALTGDGVVVWTLAVSSLVGVNMAFVWAVDQIVTQFAIRKADAYLAEAPMALAMADVHKWFLANARGLISSGTDTTATELKKLLTAHDERIDRVRNGKP